MRTLYTNPEIDILLFDEEEVLTDSNVRGVTAAEDVKAQMEHILGKESGSSGSITTVRLEDIRTQ
jgi:hypothetical protein